MWLRRDDSMDRISAHIAIAADLSGLLTDFANQWRRVTDHFAAWLRVWFQGGMLGKQALTHGVAIAARTCPQLPCLTPSEISHPASTT